MSDAREEYSRSEGQGIHLAPGEIESVTRGDLEEALEIARHCDVRSLSALRKLWHEMREQIERALWERMTVGEKRKARRRGQYAPNVIALPKKQQARGVGNG